MSFNEDDEEYEAFRIPIFLTAEERIFYVVYADEDAEAVACTNLFDLLRTPSEFLTKIQKTCRSLGDQNMKTQAQVKEEEEDRIGWLECIVSFAVHVHSSFRSWPTTNTVLSYNALLSIDLGRRDECYECQDVLQEECA